MTLAFDLDHAPLHGHYFSSMVRTENFMMIWWWKHSEKGVTDRAMGKWTESRQVANWEINKQDLSIDYKQIQVIAICKQKKNLFYSKINVDLQRQKRYWYLRLIASTLMVQTLPHRSGINLCMCPANKGQCNSLTPYHWLSAYTEWSFQMTMSAIMYKLYKNNVYCLPITKY